MQQNLEATYHSTRNTISKFMLYAILLPQKGTSCEQSIRTPQVGLLADNIGRSLVGNVL